MKPSFKRQLESINPMALMFIFVALCTIGSFPAPGISFSDFYRDSISQIGFIGLLLYWVWRNRSFGEISITISASRVWLGAVLLYAFISVFWSSQFGFFISEYMLWMAVAAVFLLTLSLKTEQKNQLIISRTLVFVGAYISIIALIQALFSVDIFSQAAPPAATFVNKNMAAQVVVLIFPFSLYLLFADKNKNLARLYPYISALMLSHIFHSSTRAAWLSVGFELFLIVLVIILYRKKIISAISNQTLFWRPKQTLHITLAAVLLVVLFNSSANGFVFFADTISYELGSIAESAQNDSSVRYLFWDAAVKMIQQNPVFGTAMGSFYYNMVYDVDTYQQFNVLRAHSDLLEMTVELGAVGLLLILGAIGSLAYSLFKLINQKNAQQQLFYLGLGVALSGSALNMQVSFPYQMAVPLMIFGLYAGLIVKAADGCGAKTKKFVFALNAKYKLIPTAVVTAIFVWILAINILWLESFVIINGNLKSTAWKDPIVSKPLSCHKDITHLLYELINIYNNDRQYKISLSVLNSFSKCVPNTWQHHATKGVILISLKRYHQAIKSLEKAKTNSPKGFYETYLNQFVAYHKTGNTKGALKIYQQLSKEPVELLRLKVVTLDFLIKISVNFKKYDDAVKFYKLRVKHHGNDAGLKNLVKAYL